MAVGSLHGAAGEALSALDPGDKAGLVRALAADWAAGRLAVVAERGVESTLVGGFPERLRLVSPRDLHRRDGASETGRASLFHAIAHIEFSAINLALDAVYRFRELPRAYYDDWLSVALEEVSHFELIRAHLLGLGADYGDLPAHGALWEMAEATGNDPLERMALIPRYLEARGLDVNPGMQLRLRQAGDLEGVAILEVILRDEIGHVARGDRWFRYLCEQRGLEPEATYRTLVARHVRNPWRGPYHCEARRQAGFSVSELERLGCG